MGKSHEKIFQQIIDFINKETTQEYFDPTWPAILQVDTSTRILVIALV